MAAGTEAPACVYVIGTLTPAGPRTYVGWSVDVTRRLAEHNGRGGRGAKSTRGRVWQLLHVEHFATKSEAMRREWALKRDRKLRKTLASQMLAGAAAPWG